MGQPIHGFLLEIMPPAAFLARPSLNPRCRWTQVPGRFGCYPALGVAAVVDAGRVTVVLKRRIRQLSPAHSLPVNQVLDLRPLAVNRVKLHSLFA
jgi:hypothetical protein